MVSAIPFQQQRHLRFLGSCWIKRKGSILRTRIRIIITLMLIPSILKSIFRIIFGIIRPPISTIVRSDIFAKEKVELILKKVSFSRFSSSPL